MYQFSDSEVISHYISRDTGTDFNCSRYRIEDRLITLENVLDLEHLAESNNLHVNCLFIISGELEKIPHKNRPKVHVKLAANCTFVSYMHHESAIAIDIDYYLTCTSFSGGFSQYRPILVCKNSWFPYQISVGRSIDLPTMRQTVVKWAANEDANRHSFFYNQELFSFSNGTFVGGVELEIPVDSDDVETDKLKKHWFTHTDYSQIEGNLECVSRPYSLQYITSRAFVNKIQKLYKFVGAPDDRELYVQSGDNSCSGVHIHISWHRKNEPLLPASLVRENYYNIAQELGGRKFLLKKGGKSCSAFDEFSKYRIGQPPGQKYDCVHMVDSNHLELRWLSNDPNPLVVGRRLKLAVDIFRQAVLQSVKQQIERTTKTYLWKTYPATLLRKPSQQPQPTAPRQT